jgi:hypothetical protein
MDLENLKWLNLMDILIQDHTILIQDHTILIQANLNPYMNRQGYLLILSRITESSMTQNLVNIHEIQAILIQDNLDPYII